MAGVILLFQINIQQLFGFILGVCLVLGSFTLQAAVYRCENETRIVEFRDTPCTSSADQQQVIPLHTEVPTAASVSAEKRTFRDLKRSLDVKQKKQLRQQARLQKEAEKQLKKEERLAEKCYRIKDKIDDVEHELRMGCKVNRCNRLQRELTKQESKYSQFCQAG